MKNNHLLILLFLGFTLTFSACKKDETTTPALTKTELLARKWGFSEVYVSGDANKVAIYGTARPATLTLKTSTTANDYLLFNKDGKLEVYTDSNKKTSAGTWKFVNSESQVQLIYDQSNVIFSVDELTEKTSEIAASVLIANTATATQDEKNIILIGALAGVVTNMTVKVKYGFKLIAK